MKNGLELVKEYRDVAMSGRVWQKTPGQMGVPELYEYLLHCQAERDRVQALLYKWATFTEFDDAPKAGIQNMIEDVTFLSEQISSVRETLNKAVNIVNTDGFFIVNVCLTLDRLREQLQVVEGNKSGDQEEEEMIRAEEHDIRELVNYWELVLADHAVSH